MPGASGVSSWASDQPEQHSAKALRTELIGDPTADRLHHQIAEREGAQERTHDGRRPAVCLRPDGSRDAKVRSVGPQQNVAEKERDNADTPRDGRAAGRSLDEFAGMGIRDGRHVNSTAPKSRKVSRAVARSGGPYRHAYKTVE
jgi:hypothetical protein